MGFAKLRKASLPTAQTVHVAKPLMGCRTVSAPKPWTSLPQETLRAPRPNCRGKVERALEDKSAWLAATPEFWVLTGKGLDQERLEGRI